MTTNTQLRPAQVAAIVYAWLRRHGYSLDFKNDVATLLAENRRARHSNVAKYGFIPYRTGLNGKAYYDFADVKKFINERLEPICKELQQKRLEKAAKAAAEARLPYAS